MEITNPDLNRYAEEHTSPESDLLKGINRETFAEVLMPRMLSGHLQGRVLSMISRMIRPSLILEIGTYTGYSALCLAEGLRDGGKIITLDINEELESRVRKFFGEWNGPGTIDYRLGDARKIIPDLPGPFDLVWIDADKENYSTYFDLVIDKVRRGGFILADNVLWSGKVLDAKPDKDTRSIQAFNKKIQDDPRVMNALLPVRDGIMMMQRI
ncbi:MAG TPA: O-methyltransferase [Cyclobacteriaceae bacterium]|nr:O-methyltransferase [Cyclobacteriaceae bacterium]